MNNFLGDDGRVIADKLKALAELDSLVHRNLFAALTTFVLAILPNGLKSIIISTSAMRFNK